MIKSCEASLLIVSYVPNVLPKLTPEKKVRLLPVSRVRGGGGEGGGIVNPHINLRAEELLPTRTFCTGQELIHLSLWMLQLFLSMMSFLRIIS